MRSDKWRLEYMVSVADLEEEWHLYEGDKCVGVFFDKAVAELALAGARLLELHAVGEIETAEDVVREVLEEKA